MRSLAAGCAVGLWTMISACRFRVVDSKLVTKPALQGLNGSLWGLQAVYCSRDLCGDGRGGQLQSCDFASYHGFPYRRAYCLFRFPLK